MKSTDSLVPKLRLGTARSKLRFPNCSRCSDLPDPAAVAPHNSILESVQYTRSGASTRCVPKRSLGTRGVLIAALLLALAPAPARAVDTDALRRKQDAQE